MTREIENVGKIAQHIALALGFDLESEESRLRLADAFFDASTTFWGVRVESDGAVWAVPPHSRWLTQDEVSEIVEAIGKWK